MVFLTRLPANPFFLFDINTFLRLDGRTQIPPKNIPTPRLTLTPHEPGDQSMRLLEETGAGQHHLRHICRTASSHSGYANLCSLRMFPELSGTLLSI